MPAEGSWDPVVVTPIGRVDAVVEFHRDEGRLRGTAQGAGERVPLEDLVERGE